MTQSSASPAEEEAPGRDPVEERGPPELAVEEQKHDEQQHGPCRLDEEGEQVSLEHGRFRTILQHGGRRPGPGRPGCRSPSLVAVIGHVARAYNPPDAGTGRRHCRHRAERARYGAAALRRVRHSRSVRALHAGVVPPRRGGAVPHRAVRARRSCGSRGLPASMDGAPSLAGAARRAPRRHRRDSAGDRLAAPGPSNAGIARARAAGVGTAARGHGRRASRGRGARRGPAPGLDRRERAPRSNEPERARGPRVAGRPLVGARPCRDSRRLRRAFARALARRMGKVASETNPVVVRGWSRTPADVRRRGSRAGPPIP